jgi:hypothetical protein
VFDLMELSTGNLLGSYEHEEEALRDVRETAEAFGADAVASLALAVVDDKSGILLAEGAELLERANASTSLAGFPAVAG